MSNEQYKIKNIPIILEPKYPSTSKVYLHREAQKSLIQICLMIKINLRTIGAITQQSQIYLQFTTF